ncbi:hypothetical protein PVK06_023470 [Gossypium arboreum]|uniref:Uncharacterized protein n=1 Tax=Gossypium arboreum TaxID=29729 RepID=A0ABR0PB84_GOSAR|nr:hypothetical protein PVK06_023470 [Gossypium arboreum]
MCFREIHFQHIHISENSKGHRLAKNTLERGEILYLMGEGSGSQESALDGRWSQWPD